MAAKKTIAELLIDLKVKDDEIKKAKKELDDLKDKAKKTGDETEKAGKKGAKGLTRIQKAAKVAKFALKGAKKAAQIAGKAFKAMSVGVAAIIAAGVGLVTFVQEFAGMSDEQTKLAETTGLSAEEFERLAFAAKQSGADVETLSAAIRTYNKTLEDNLKSGSGPVLDSLKELGITSKDVSGSMEENLGVIGDALNGVEDKAHKAALQSRLFGEDAGPKLASLLKEGSEGIKGLGDQAKITTEDQRKGFTKFMDSMGTLKDVLGGVMADVLLPLLPVITNIAEKLGGLFSGLIESGILDMFVKLLNEALEVIFEVAAELLPVFSEIAESGLFEALVSTFKVLLPIVKDLIKIMMPGLKFTLAILPPIIDALNAILAVVGVITFAITKLVDKFEKWASKSKFLTRLNDGIQNLGSSMDIFARSTAAANAEMSGLVEGVKNLVKVEKLSKLFKDKFGPPKPGEGVETGKKKADTTVFEEQKRINILLEKARKGKKKGGGLTAAEESELTFTLNVPTNLVDKAIAEGTKKDNRKKGGKKKDTSEITLDQFIGSVRGGKGSPAELAAIAKQLSASTPEAKDIKPTVAITFLNFENNFKIKSTDPQKAADNIIKIIKNQMQKANTKAGGSLSSNLIS